MPSSTISANSEFFTFKDLSIVGDLVSVPVLKGRVWATEERNPTWTVECGTFEEFSGALQKLSGRLSFLAFDESVLDEETIYSIQEELQRYAAEEGISQELVVKAISALRSHENEIFAVLSYAFLESGQVLFVRVQNELARFVYHPDRLLSSEGLSTVRKLRTLVENSPSPS